MSSNRPYLLRAMHEWICDNGLTPHVVADTTQPGVEVPPQAVREGRVVLNLAPRAVTRLEIGNEMITCMARFSGVSHALRVPIAAVQAIYAQENGQGMLLAPDEPGTATVAGSERSAAETTPTLKSVPTPGQQDAGEESGQDPDTLPDDGQEAARPKGKPTLHVVK